MTIEYSYVESDHSNRSATRPGEGDPLGGIRIERCPNCHLNVVVDLAKIPEKCGYCHGNLSHLLEKFSDRSSDPD